MVPSPHNKFSPSANGTLGKWNVLDAATKAERPSHVGASFQPAADSLEKLHPNVNLKNAEELLATLSKENPGTLILQNRATTGALASQQKASMFVMVIVKCMRQAEKEAGADRERLREQEAGAVTDAISAAASEFGTSEANMVAQLRLLATLLPGLPPLFDIFKSVGQDKEMVEILLHDIAYLITRGQRRGREFDLSQKFWFLISKTERHFPYWVDDARRVMTQSSLLLNSAKRAIVDSKVSGTHSGRIIISTLQLLGHLYCIPWEVAAQKIVLLGFCLRGGLIPLLIRYPSLLALDVETLQRQVDVPPSLPSKTPGSMTNHHIPRLGIGTHDTDVNESVLYELIHDDFPDECDSPSPAPPPLVPTFYLSSPRVLTNFTPLIREVPRLYSRGTCVVTLATLIYPASSSSR
eukprot:gene1553-32935_t